MKMCKLRRMHAWCNFPLYGACHDNFIPYKITYGRPPFRCLLSFLIQNILFDWHLSPSFSYVLFPHLNMLSVGMCLWKPSVMVELEWPLTSEVSLLVTGLATSQASRARMISEKSAALMFLKCSCCVSTSFKSCHETEYFTIQLCFSTWINQINFQLTELIYYSGQFWVS